MTLRDEVKEFPYGKVDDRVRERYKEIFALKTPLKGRFGKVIFDRLFATVLIILLSPLFVSVLVAVWMDGMIHPCHRGPLLQPYIASNRGKKFLKYKFRLTRVSSLKRGRLRRFDWRVIRFEGKKRNLTCVGTFLKKYYLDELPQIFNILKGEMSFVGPRAIDWQRYVINVRQGDVSRKIMTAGLFSETHVRKGTADNRNIYLTYDYIEKYRTFSDFSLFWHDAKIIGRGVRMVFKGEG